MNIAEFYSNQGGELLASDPRIGQRLIGQAIRLAPDEGICCFNLGIALHQQRKINACIRAYEIALQTSNPPLKSIHQNLAQDLLLAGRFNEGWELYEQRFKPGENDFFFNLLGSPWQGPEIEGWPPHLVLTAEQGFGDTLQFCRFAIQLQELGIRVTLFCQPQLIEFLRIHSTLNDVVSEINHDQLKDGSRWCPLMSLPHRLKTEVNSIPKASPYFHANADGVDHWRKLLRQKPKTCLVGIHWQGNPKHEKTLYSRGRSMPLQTFNILTGVEGVEFVSLQKGSGSEQRNASITIPFVDGQAAFDASMDFSDTAAVLQLCDLIITADSGIVHLASGLGRPTWVALRWVPEWRWLLNGETTPWYQNLRLFRQPEDGDWASAMTEINSAFQEWLKTFNEC
ncbi:glycosyltransferase family 9 protein [Synechococcus sp. KORDI-100]|uniref:glycosyltransferase family 9 protein n=1 Tax=Synechococcus sp. KORDI-100 TaxID=1280380 RepID=UPI0012E0576E|nr:glycosyltransferase family 9 protein [Synechococcus sp. KORDI-100]